MQDCERERARTGVAHHGVSVVFDRSRGRAKGLQSTAVCTDRVSIEFPLDAFRARAHPPVTVCPTFGFSRGPSSNGNTHHNGTTGGSRTMEAEPRMPPRQNPYRTKAAGCKPVLCPAATIATIGSGGKKFQAKPATEIQDPTISRQRGLSRCHEARRVNERAMFWFCHNGTESHEARAISTKRRVGKERCQRIRMVRGDGQRQSKPGGPDYACRSATVGNVPSVSPSKRHPTSCTKREPSAGKTRRRWSAATLQDRAQNNPSISVQRQTCQQATPRKS